jgi:hypothetical protein
MFSTVTTVKALLAGFTTLPRVSGEPTFKNIALATMADQITDTSDL